MTTSTLHPTLNLSQTQRYAGFYDSARRVLTSLRFDVRYRQQRLHEVLFELGICVGGTRVLDVGFGAGDLLASFPHTCHLVGVDVSESAVEQARLDDRFDAYEAAEFHSVPEHAPRGLPPGPFDLALSSHHLEHVPDDGQVLRELRKRLRTGGILAVFVPIEEPDYILFHRRNYSLQSITERVAQAGFDVLHVEGSMYVNGHLWKVLTIPSRRQWPLVRHAADALRVGSLGVLSYRSIRCLDQLLFRLGAGARQALVIARRSEHPLY